MLAEQPHRPQPQPYRAAAVPGAATGRSISPSTAPHPHHRVPHAAAAPPAEGAARRGLDRQAAGRRRCGGHADRRRAAAGAGRAGRHPAPGVPGGCRRRAGRGSGGGGMLAEQPARRPGRRDRAGRDRCRRGLHGRHRGHHDLRLGGRAGRADPRRRHRRRRADPGPPLGFRASRAAGAGAADRAGAGRHRRHHAAARRLHAGVVRRVGAGATGQGLDLAALRAHRGQQVSAADGPLAVRTSIPARTSGWSAPAQSRRWWRSSPR